MTSIAEAMIRKARKLLEEGLKKQSQENLSTEELWQLAELGDQISELAARARAITQASVQKGSAQP